MKSNHTLGILRRLAPRVLWVHGRHRHENLDLLAYDQTLIVAAHELIDCYDRARRSATGRVERRERGLAAIDALRKKLWVWATYMSIDVDSFDPARYGQVRDLPEHVLEDARDLLAWVARRDEDGRPLGYAPELREAIGAALAHAEQAWAEAERIGIELVELRRATHEVAGRFQSGLVRYRRSLAAVVGRDHPDFRKLQSRLARDVDTVVTTSDVERGISERSGDWTPAPM